MLACKICTKLKPLRYFDFKIPIPIFRFVCTIHIAQYLSLIARVMSAKLTLKSGDISLGCFVINTLIQITVLRNRNFKLIFSKRLDTTFHPDYFLRRHNKQRIKFIQIESFIRRASVYLQNNRVHNKARD